jgi:pimeloyl-ACP methyl ester carboxylesterase
MRNFAVNRDFRRDLAGASGPITIISGADDELMFADKYAASVHAVAPAVDVKLIDGINHMGIVSVPRAVSAIAADVATRGITGS